MPAGPVLRLRDRRLPLGERTLLMGILNITPDSFSDGGRWSDQGQAIEHGLEMVAEGADIVDIGGESTRPGAEPVTAEEEWRRIGPVVTALAARGVAVSVDTYKSETARRALDAGAVLVNDISGGSFDPGLIPAAAGSGAGLVLTHIKGTPRTMREEAVYHDLLGEIISFLARQVMAARQAGVAADSLVVDPGLGFGKRPEHNLEIIRRLQELRALGQPILVGASRKSFIGALTGLPPHERVEGSLAAAALAVAGGADLLRVHDVRATARLCAVVDAVARGA